LPENKIRIETNFGFIKFLNAEDAKEAIRNKDKEEIKALYHG